MTIIFPREMPIKGASLQEFEIQRVDFSAPEAGGRLGGVQAGFPLWFGVWDIGRIGMLASDVWRAWLSSLRGSQKPFFARDLARPYPLSRINGFAGMTRAGGGAFGGSATTWSQSINGEGVALLQLTGLPASLVLSVGDYVGFKWDAGDADPGTYGRRTIARVIEGATSNGSGVLTVAVEPPVPTGIVPGDAIAHLDLPCCVMRQITAETKLAGVDRRLAIGGGKIVAVQDLRP